MNQVLTTRLSGLHDLCIARLRDCLDASSGLLARQIRDGDWGPTLGTERITSTAICLIGLSRAGIAPGAVFEDPAATCRRLAAELRRDGYPGGLGLVLWANAALRAHSPSALLAEAGLDAAALERAIPALTTMEVAWMASGLLHAADPGLERACTAALQELQRQRLVPDTLAFRHASAAASWQHRLRARIANFADQVYPLQALSFAAIARGDATLRVLADRCGAHLVGMQGPLGQWWWHYDAVTGGVIEGFPVYSVHQHSMAPMALRALAAAGGCDHTSAAALSRDWLQANELGIDMVEPSSGIIWRSIEREERSLAGRLRKLRILLARPASNPAAAPPRLRLNREIRPYEWGWLLYATAVEGSVAPSGHII